MSTRSLGQLTLDLVTKTGGWVQGMNKAERSSKKWRRQVQKDLRVVGKAFAGAAAVAAAGLTTLTVQGQQFIDSQAKTSARLGSTIDDLRAVQIAASDFGIEQGRLESSLASYTKRLGDAARGTGEAQKAYEALGLEAKELVNLPLPEQLALIAERISQVGSAAERTSIADRLMSGGRDMVNLFEEGGDAIRAAVAEVDEYGLSLSRVDASKVEAANDAISRIPRLLEPIKTSLAISLADPIRGITNEFLEAGKATAGFRDDITGMVDSAVGGLLHIIDAGDGVKRVFQITGRVIALWAIESQRLMLNVAETIYSGPIDAVNALIEQMNRIPGLDLGLVEQTGAVRDLQRQIKLLEGAGEIARQDMQDILTAPMASEGFRDSIDASRADAPTLGGTGVGMVNPTALAAVDAVAEGLQRTTDAANDNADATDDQTDTTKDATRAVQTFGDTAVRSAQAMAAAAGMGSDPRYNITAGGDTVEERARARFEQSAFRVGESSVINYPPASSQGVDKIQRSVSQVSGSPAGAKDRGAVTIKVVGENGSTEGAVEGDDAFVKQLVNALSGASSASSSR
jgi:hypothetical protein